ncbi:MAG: hypothetical protein LUG26_00745 [Ruminococcus sp.]|nr:hypothetical protein [Ruminococcus sp.]
MNRIRKFVAALTAFALAATMSACTIGSSSAMAVTIDGYDVDAGIFIYYTIQSYYDVQELVAEESGDSTVTPTIEEVEDATIDGLEATEWIQDKATQYCSDFITIEREFEKIGAELTDEELDEIDTLVESALENELFTENGISEDSIVALASSSYKGDHIFDYYYGTESELGMSEEELMDYFDENFARVKYVTMSYLDSDGNKLDETGKKEIRDLADEYADRVNAVSDDMEKLYEIDDVNDDYTAYVEEQSAEEEEDTEETTTTTTTTTTTDTETTTTTTTTTNPYANEQIVQKITTTTADDSEDESATTTTDTDTDSSSDTSTENLTNFIFEELTEYNKAVVFDDEDNNAIYVVIRADLRKRLTEDDLWTEDNITYLESLNFGDAYSDYMEEISDSLTVEKNTRAYKRYKPFKITLETS